jgi:hypothetical protein
MVEHHFIFSKFVMDNIFDVNIFLESAITRTMGGRDFPTKGVNNKEHEGTQIVAVGYGRKASGLKTTHQPKCFVTLSAIKLPIGIAEVAAGEGALQT